MKKVILFIAIFVIGCTTNQRKDTLELNIDQLDRVVQELVSPPYLPKHKQVDTGKPKIVEVRIVIEEKTIQVSDNAAIHVTTFNGSVPGSIIVVHQDDYVKFTLVNPETSLHIQDVALYTIK